MEGGRREVRKDEEERFCLFFTPCNGLGDLVEAGRDEGVGTHSQILLFDFNSSQAKC